MPEKHFRGEARSEAGWKASITSEAWAFHDAFIAWTQANLGEVRPEVLRALVLARIIEPSRKLDLLRSSRRPGSTQCRTRSGSANLVHYDV